MSSGLCFALCLQLSFNCLLSMALTISALRVSTVWGVTIFWLFLFSSSHFCLSYCLYILPLVASLKCAFECLQSWSSSNSLRFLGIFLCGSYFICIWGWSNMQAFTRIPSIQAPQVPYIHHLMTVSLNKIIIFQMKNLQI